MRKSGRYKFVNIHFHLCSKKNNKKSRYGPKTTFTEIDLEAQLWSLQPRYSVDCFLCKLELCPCLLAWCLWQLHRERHGKMTWQRNPYLWFQAPFCCYLVAQSCLTSCTPMDCSPLGFSTYGIFQTRILEWVAIPFSRWSSRLRDQICVSCIDSLILCHWATWEAQSSF